MNNAMHNLREMRTVIQLLWPPHT